MKKNLIGITGSISSGKSKVSEYLKEKGYLVIDTDKITHDLYEYGNKGYIEIAAHFPNAISGNCVDRKKLGEIVFNNPDKLKLLNSIIHPLVKEELLNQVKLCDDEIIFVEVPLLFEANFDKECNKILCVYVNNDIQIKRLMKRNNIDKIEALKLINKQMDINTKAKLSDYVIDNSYDISNTYQEIDKFLLKLKEDLYA